MQRHIIGRQRQYFFQTVDHIIKVLTRQPQYQIHVDLPIRRAAQFIERSNDIFRRMSTPDPIQRPLLHRLRIDTHSADIELFHQFDLRRRDRIGSTAFNRKLFNIASVKRSNRPIEHTLKMFIGQTRRRPATNVYRLHLEIIFFNITPRGIEIAFEHRHKFCNLLFAGQHVRRKRTI